MTPSRNSYLAYKRDTSCLLYWIVQTSNSIIKSLTTSNGPLDGIDGAPMLPLTSAEITVAGLVSLSKFVAKHIDSVPSTILTLFQSVIDARTAAHDAFQQMSAKTPDPDVEKSNASHKRFIDALKESFDALGGRNWKPDSSSDEEAGLLADTEHAKEKLDRLVANRFGALEIHGSPEADEDSDQEGPQEIDANVPRQRKQAKPGKGKKGKKGKGKKHSATKPAHPKEESLAGLPLESYRIIQDQEGIMTDYLMAVYDLMRQCMDLRHYLEKIWREVAYEGLNSAVAGALSNTAIAMIQRSAAEIFIDFPGHDSYETVMNTMTRGDVEKAQSMFQVSLLQFWPDRHTPASMKDQALDIKELFLIHAYRDLLDFVTDFQKTRTGKPTKRMLAEIKNWDPKFDLMHATDEERIRWRRSYTINWLYDLVNAFSCIVVQRNTLDGENHVYEEVDWSPKGPWNQWRRLYGLNEFAGFVTSLAMQKPGTNVRDRILPHHVFQLQCIIDSFTVSRGWTHHFLNRHKVVAPPPSYRFHPRRDVDKFLDREVTREGRGVLQAFYVIKQLFERDGVLHGDMRRHWANYEILEQLNRDYLMWLGKSKYADGLENMPPSRFSHVNTNGLWDYSPFLCGVGLEEALELAYISVMLVWDDIPEPMMVLHLHNMLLKEGYMKKENAFLGVMGDLFSECFFPDGVPVANYNQALRKWVRPRGTPRERKAKHAAASAGDVHGLLNPTGNHVFRQKSFLVLLRQAGWNPDRIPDADIISFPGLGSLRLTNAKFTVDPVSGEKCIEETEIIKEAKARGVSEASLSKLIKHGELIRTKQKSMCKELSVERPTTAASCDAYCTCFDTIGSVQKRMAASAGQIIIPDAIFLDFLKNDLKADIVGYRPMSALNLLWCTVWFYLIFEKIEEELEKRRNPLWVRAYEKNTGKYSNQKRVTLTMLAMIERDQECLEVMADALKKSEGAYFQYIYWDELELKDPKKKSDHRPIKVDSYTDSTECSVM